MINGVPCLSNTDPNSPIYSGATPHHQAPRRTPGIFSPLHADPSSYYWGVGVVRLRELRCQRSAGPSVLFFPEWRQAQEAAPRSRQCARCSPCRAQTAIRDSPIAGRRSVHSGTTETCVPHEPSRWYPSCGLWSQSASRVPTSRAYTCKNTTMS